MKSEPVLLAKVAHAAEQLFIDIGIDGLEYSRGRIRAAIEGAHIRAWDARDGELRALADDNDRLRAERDECVKLLEEWHQDGRSDARLTRDTETLLAKLRTP